MEIDDTKFAGIVIATNNKFPHGISQSQFMKGGIKVKCCWNTVELFALRMLITVTLAFRLKLHAIPTVSWGKKGPIEIPFSLLGGQKNPCPVTFEEGSYYLTPVEFMIDKIANCTKAGLTSYKNYKFYWSAELLNGGEIVCTITSPMYFHMRAVSAGRRNRVARPSNKRRKLEPSPPASPSIPLVPVVNPVPLVVPILPIVPVPPASPVPVVPENSGDLEDDAGQVPGTIDYLYTFLDLPEEFIYEQKEE